MNTRPCLIWHSRTDRNVQTWSWTTRENIYSREGRYSVETTDDRVEELVKHRPVLWTLVNTVHQWLSLLLKPWTRNNKHLHEERCTVNTQQMNVHRYNTSRISMLPTNTDHSLKNVIHEYYQYTQHNTTEDWLTFKPETYSLSWWQLLTVAIFTRDGKRRHSHRDGSVHSQHSENDTISSQPAQSIPQWTRLILQRFLTQIFLKALVKHDLWQSWGSIWIEEQNYAWHSLPLP